jgi:hypothetical protein
LGVFWLFVYLAVFVGFGGVSVFYTKKHSNIQDKAEYMRVRKNYKSVKKYKEEKQRRKQVLKLQDQGLTVGAVALRLGVSESTVKRDLDKMKCYLKGQFNRFKLGENEWLRSEWMGWSLQKRVDYVCNLHKVELKSRRVHRCRGLVITVDFDAALSGRYGLRFRPNLLVDLGENSPITVEIVVCGRKQILGRTYVGQIKGDLVGLQTNQSLNVFVKNVLKGLRVVELPIPPPVGSCFG